MRQHKKIFAEKYHDLLEETKVTTGDASFHSDNAMQDIRGGALEHLAMAAGDEKDIVTKLTDVMEQLTKNNAPLTTKLSDDMKLVLRWLISLI